MKKLNVLLIVAMLATALLAANPPGKLVVLEIINKTEFPVYMKLEGEITDAFYYLTVPEGSQSDPTDKTFTILTDVYKRTTWACDGIQSSGKLYMSGNVRLTFTPCFVVPLRTVRRWYESPPYDFTTPDYYMLWRFPNFGEPTMEKVFYFKAYDFAVWYKFDFDFWEAATCLVGPCHFAYWHWWMSWLGVKLNVANRTYKGPLGVWWRYQY